MKFDQPKAGEWVQPITKGYRFRCCDCKLVHRMDFRVSGKRAQFRVYRDTRSTKAARKGIEVTIKIKPVNTEVLAREPFVFPLCLNCEHDKLEGFGPDEDCPSCGLIVDAAIAYSKRFWKTSSK